MYTSSHRSPAPYISAAILAVTTAAVAAYYHRGVWYEWFNVTILVAVDQLEANVIAWKRRLQLEGGSNPDHGNNGNAHDGVVSVKPIGVVRSVYRLCVGTPRQGLLSPQSRGRIELTVENASDMIDGLEGFSHIWVFFVFHLNTVSKSNKPPTKIAPPALGGKKVGVLATRSPHRNNPIGMTLCKLDSISTSGGSKKKSQRKSSGMLVVLNISGLDLVDGTPVLDVKPYVPHYDSVEGPDLRLPTWVSGGLETKREVRISDQARSQLLAILKTDPFVLDFYGPHRGDECIMNTMKSVLQCIEQVLSIDVRSSWQTSKARVGKSQAERADRIQHAMVTTPMSSFHSSDSTDQMCSQQLDNLLIHYSVNQPDKINREASKGSGAEDVVTVQSIQLLLQPRPTHSEEQQSARQPPMLSPNFKGDSGSIHSYNSALSSPPRVIFPK
jgi:tRNA (adenine37-N6)-methyltransferase